MGETARRSIAIVGLGSWGLCVLERVVDCSRRTGRPTTVHVVDPGTPGGGVYGREQPDYLVLNNPCGQLSLHASPDADPGLPYAMGLFEWATWRGYRRFGYEYRIATGGAPLSPGDYLPRRLMGEYLGWFYETLRASAPDNLEIVAHRTVAEDIVSEPGYRERVVLGDGSAVTVDHVILTSGHTFNEEGGGDGTAGARPYPVGFFVERLRDGEPVAVSGMGLVAFDLLTALSVGRGGSFEADGDAGGGGGLGGGLRYRASGREPVIHLFSRSGLPYLAKSVSGLDPTGSYRPLICTPEALSALRSRPAPAQTDFRSDVVPLLAAEMQVRYYSHAAFLAHGAPGAERVRSLLGSAWSEGRFAEALGQLAGCHRPFRPEDYLLPQPEARFASAADYESHAYDLIAADLADATQPGGSPVKAALEVTRILRDDLRSVIEFGGLSLQSYLDFQSNIRGRINRIEAGPPPMRSAQLMALMDAGVARICLGPAPEVEAVGEGMLRLRSTALDRRHEVVTSTLIRGHLDLPSLAHSASPLLVRLYRLGRLTQMTYGDTAVGSVAISEDFHPFDSEGRLQSTISVLGVLTEGVRYFTHYLPSPKSRIRAVRDAQACVEAVIG
jgi:uncharacterized NAD(P)/FAD-binding protein YdhS